MLSPMKYSNTIIECRINILRLYFFMNTCAVLYVKNLLWIHKLSIFPRNQQRIRQTESESMMSNLQKTVGNNKTINQMSNKMNSPQLMPTRVFCCMI